MEELSLYKARLVFGAKVFSFSFCFGSIFLIPFHSISSARLIDACFSPAQHPLPAHPKVKILPNQSKTGLEASSSFFLASSFFFSSSHFFLSCFSSSIYFCSSHLDFLSYFFLPLSIDDSISSIGFSNFTFFASF